MVRAILKNPFPVGPFIDFERPAGPASRFEPYRASFVLTDSVDVSDLLHRFIGAVIKRGSNSDGIRKSYPPGVGSVDRSTAAVGIPIRLYLLAATVFNYRGLGIKYFKSYFPFLLPLDELWALAPFLIVRQIGIGLAISVTAALLYLPFSQRSLLLMGFSARKRSNSAKWSALRLRGTIGREIPQTPCARQRLTR